VSLGLEQTQPACKSDIFAVFGVLSANLGSLPWFTSVPAGGFCDNTLIQTVLLHST
jgi:hypothetical protein